MIKAYFFDWMGTLGEVADVLNIKDLIGLKRENLLLSSSSVNVVPLNQKERVCVERALYEAKFSLYSDSKKIIRGLKKKYRLAIVSNVYPVTNQRLRQSFPDFLNNFDIITFSSEVGMRKPNLEIFRYTLKKLNKTKGLSLQPSEAMMIGDKKEYDIKPARDFGMQARLIDRNKQNLDDVI